MRRAERVTTFLVGLAAGAAMAALALSLAPRGAVPTDGDQVGGAVDGKYARCDRDQLEHNRRLVRSFFAPQRSPLDAYNLMTPDYVQHNEGVRRFGQINGLEDREAFKAIDEILTKRALRPELLAGEGRPRNRMASRIIATCDYVVALHQTFAPDPQNIGKFYPAFDFELWRIRDGKFAEHWDSQRIPTPVPDLMRAPIGADEKRSPVEKRS